MEKKQNTLANIDSRVPDDIKWQNLKFMHKDYKPSGFPPRGEDRKNVRKEDRAKVTAELLTKYLWCFDDQHLQQERLRTLSLRKEIIVENTRGNGDITEHDIDAALRKLKTGKATGPDNIPAEFLTTLKHTHRNTKRTIFNQWYKDQGIPSEY